MFFFVSYLYGTVLIKSPSQTNFEEYKAKYPNRIFPQFLLNSFTGRTCEFCHNKAKNIRSSHCTTCKVCVLKRDHHCPWINKCIGYTNMQYFNAYLIWLMVYEYLYFQGFIKYYNSTSGFSIVKPIIAIFALLTIGVFVSLINLFLQNLVAFLNEAFYYETTKTENMERYYLCCKQKDMSFFNSNPYNKGWLFNFECCIGPTLLHIFFPLPKQYKYDINENDITFRKCAVAEQNEIIRALSGKKYDTMENIRENYKLQSSPNTFLEYARAQYNGKNIKII